MKIQFETPKEVVIVKERKKTFSEINVRDIVDNPNLKTVTAFIDELGFIVLWKGAEYDAIGQWTDSDVINKLKLMY